MFAKSFRNSVPLIFIRIEIKPPAMMLFYASPEAMLLLFENDICSGISGSERSVVDGFKGFDQFAEGEGVRLGNVGFVFVIAFDEAFVARPNGGDQAAEMVAHLAG